MLLKALTVPLIHPNLRLFRLGVVATALSLLLVCTPVHWWIESQLWGVEDHYYPELFWMATALPLSLSVVVGGLISALIVGQEVKPVTRAPCWRSGEIAGETCTSGVPVAPVESEGGSPS